MQGERRFFRVCFHWLAIEYPEIAKRNLELVPEYRRWDDLLYSVIGTSLENDALTIIKEQLAIDIESKTPSLLAKWLPSENASSRATKITATKVREYLGFTHKQYRKILSELRKRINVLERLMSAGRWDDIKFDQIPSKAGMKYRNTFAVKEVTAARYAEFIKSKDSKVNANTLYPYEIVNAAQKVWNKDLDDTKRLAINKYWENQKDYLNGQPCKMLCVCDTSGSMTWGAGNVHPIDVAISLSLYCAERVGEPFKDYYISFSSRPQLIATKGVDFVDKVQRIYRTNLCENTDLVKTFKMLKDISLKANPEDRLDTIVVISDMEIDSMTIEYYDTDQILTEMERIRLEWEQVGLIMPKLVYWNVNARNDRILDMGPNVSFVSGANPVIFEGVLTGKSGVDLMLNKLLSKRYEPVK